MERKRKEEMTDGWWKDRLKERRKRKEGNWRKEGQTDRQTDRW